MSEYNRWTIGQCEDEIKTLQAKAAPKIKNLKNLSYNEVYELERLCLKPIGSGVEVKELEAEGRPALLWEHTDSSPESW